MSHSFAIFLLGPTAAGKSDLALRLAERFDAEIVSIDSALVYRGMDIGTAKPDAAQRARVPHHLIDIVTPAERYSAGEFRGDALAAMAQITARGKLPLLVGGTMMYYKVLTEGLHELPRADAALREQIEDRAAAEGWPALHADLVRVDPASAKRLQPTDAQRISRALEVFHLTGTPWSELLQARAAAPFPYTTVVCALVPQERALLHQRIAQRFEQMLRGGLVEEVEQLKLRYELSAALPSMRCVGYRQVWQYLAGEFDRTGLRERAIAATRQLAKRQLTWLRSLPGIELFECFAADVAQRLDERVARALGGWL